MDRRSFIAKTSIAGAASMLPQVTYAKTNKSEYKLGYQLFSINKDMNEDTIGTLKAAKKMGYRDFEIYGFDPDKVTYYGYKATELKQILDDMGVTVTSGHYGFSDYLHKPEDELKRFVDQCIKGAKALNTPYITWPWLHPDYRNMENYKIMIGKLNIIGEQITAAGLGFAYHNHGFEFEDHNGEIAYDLIMSETDPELVKLQMDMYWVMHSSNYTPIELVKKQPGRFVMWHIKDMDVITRDYTELGNGSINYLNLLPDPAESGLEYYYIEQGGNFTYSAMKSAETSAKYFKKYLSKLI